MTVSLFDSELYGDLFSDREIVALLDDRARLRAMLEVEAALARVQGRLGVIPAAAATRIAEVAESLELDPAALAPGTASAGVPVPALVASLRAAVGAEAGAYVHWGATSQDIMDSGLVLRLRAVLDALDGRLAGTIETLAALAQEHRGTVMAARTRSQQALPTTFGLKAAGWLLPLARHRERLAQLRPRLLVVQFGGAAGTLAALGATPGAALGAALGTALGEDGVAVMEALATELGLAIPPAPWHSQRDGIAELAAWFALVTGSLGKIGEDLVLLAQSEVGEVTPRSGPGGGGGSSTLPQKTNPVAAEALVTLARFNAGLLTPATEALLQAQERGGAAWALEWLTLPQMAAATGAALRLAAAALDGLVVDTARMAANLEASNGLILAEAASFALAAHMPRPEAQALVKAACAEVTESGRHLMDVLAEMSEAPLDWAGLKEPAGYLGAADALINRILASLAPAKAPKS
jgi:3-carboxy-cis,cis-muconate cycloisomerase